MSRSSSGRQIGLLWGAVATALVVLSPLAPRIAAGLPGCIFRAVTGIPCPTCGATHAALALSRLDLIQAFAWNPLVTIGLVFLVAGGLLSGLRALRGLPVPEPTRYPLWLRGLAALAIAGNWVWVIATRT